MRIREKILMISTVSAWNLKLLIKPTAIIFCIILTWIDTNAQFSLTVSKSGAGSGNVITSPTGIECGSICSASFPSGFDVTIVATPDAISTFDGWSGAVTGTNAIQTITMNGNKAVTAIFSPKSYTLTVSKSGTGSGTITSSPSGINCGANCSADYTAGSSITLTATPDAGSVFNGWSGGGCSGTGDCVVSMSSAITVTADFSYTLNSYYNDLDGDGWGAGDVIFAATQPPNTSIHNMDCDDSNPLVHPGSTEICGNATDEDCDGSLNDCTMYPFTVSKAGSGSGTISSSPAGLDCGSTCTALFPEGASVTFTATPDATSSFGGWTGAFTGINTTQTIIMNGPKSASAVFIRNTYLLNIFKAGSGSGTVSSSPAGISCGGMCASSYMAGTSVTLTATPDAGSVFTGWTGGGCSGTGACVVPMMSATTVTANFCSLPVVPETISGNQLICSGTLQTYSIPDIPTATSYSWSLPSGWTGTSTTNSINVITGNTGAITVNAINSCGSGPVRTMNVTVKSAPLDLNIKNGLVAGYPFNNNANDASGNSINGVVHNASLTEDRFGNPNKAYNFNGSSSYIDFGDVNMLNPHKNSVTITAWVKKGSLNQHSRIFSKGTHGGPQPGYDLMFYGTSGPSKAAVILSAGGHEHIVYSNNPISDLNWHFYAGVINRQGYINLYVDGIKQNDSINISNHQGEDIAVNTYNAFIGASYSYLGNPGPISEFLNGVIDEVQIYMRVLSDAEVKGIFNPVALSLSTDHICENNPVQISLGNSQNGISYQMQNYGADFGNPQTGDGSTLTFNSGNLSSTAMFSVKASNIASECSITLDTVMKVNVFPVYNYNENYAICDGETYRWHGIDYTTTGTYTAAYTTIHGCDSIYTLHLSVNPVFHYNVQYTICEGETYTWQGNNFSVSGTYTAAYTTVLGCDSIYTLNLTVNPRFEYNQEYTMCEGEIYTWQGNEYSDAGHYTAEYATIHGCDSIYTLNLVVNPVYEFNQTVKINDGEVYSWHGNTYSDAGTYTAAYSTINGCDSIYTLHLAIDPVYEINQEYTMCDGEVYTWQGNEYTDAGNYTASYTTINGGDSIYTLNLVVNPVFTFDEDYTICEGETYFWQGNEYSEAGTYSKTYTSINGCDSLYTLNLTVNAVNVSVTVTGSVITADLEGAIYQWINCDNSFENITGETSGSFTASSDGNYAVVITQGSCTDTSLCIPISTVDITGIRKEEVSVYPNPVTNQLFIEIKGSREITSFEILNPLGQVVLKDEILGTAVVETRNFNPGIYYVKLKCKTASEIKKIVIE